MTKRITTKGIKETKHTMTKFANYNYFIVVLYYVLISIRLNVHMDTWTYRYMSMWTYGHLDIWIQGHVAVKQDITIYITVY
jgi:hypothetical protein